MARKRSRMPEHLARSLKLVAVVIVLGFVLLAAEQRLAQDISPEEIVVTETAPVFAIPGAGPAQAATSDYVPSH